MRHTTAKLLGRAAAQLAARDGHASFLTVTRSLASAAQHGGRITNAVDPGAHLQQRYAAMLQSGVLKPDQHQHQLVLQLSALLQQLDAYSQSVSTYRVAKDAYDAKYQQRLSELKEQDDLHKQQQQQDAQHQPQQQKQQGWLQRLLSSAGLAASSNKPTTPTPQQRARQAAAARHAQVKQQLGPGPESPAPPQGLYVYGSVGSGKSLLMDMFYDTARQHLKLDHSRRLHFNAAMLELHSRLHHLDVKRQQRQLRQRQEKEAAAAAATVGPSSSGSSNSSSSELLHARGKDIEGDAADGAGFSLVHESAEQVDGGGCDDAASDGQVSAWFDDGVARQKEAKAAVLAIRRHLREARAGRVPETRLAAANADVMSAAARSFIRAGGPDPTAGWGGSQGAGGGDRLAALLCFDEMQVGDVFSAAALKAMLEALTAEGCVVVTTSNRHPADLPRHGLHEAMFGHFLNTLFTSCRLFELSAGTDYRRLSLTGPATQLLQQPLLAPATAAAAGASSSTGTQHHSSSSIDDGTAQRLYYWPLNPVAEAALNQKWAQALGSCTTSSNSGSSSKRSIPHQLKRAALASSGSSSGLAAGSGLLHSSPAAPAAVLPVLFGRQLAVPRCAAGVAWFDFDQLCGGPLGAADYMAVAQNYHTVFISGIPAMSMEIRDRARRFITLVDELYNARVLLVCSAALPPDQLFAGAEGDEPILDLEGLQFEGAVEGSKLRTNLLADGGVAPVASSAAAAAETTALLGGMEERFAFSRAVSRLYEMQSPLYAAARPRQ